MKIHSVSALPLLALATEAKRLWTTTPADPNNVMFEAYTIGNGAQGGLPLGIPGNDKLLIMHDSLWRGGPFANPNYNGGNPKQSIADRLRGVQTDVFKHGTGDESPLYGNMDDYGSYEMLGNLTVAIAGAERYTNYKRSLDLNTALHTVNFTANGQDFSTTQFCSFPDKVCVYHIRSDKNLPEVTVGLIDEYRTAPASTNNCTQDGIRLSGRTAANPGMGEIGMKLDGHAQILKSNGVTYTCKDGKMVTTADKRRSLTIVVATGTEYDAKKGNAASGYSFRGDLPYPAVLSTVKKLDRKCYSTILSQHVRDHQSLFDKFSLELPDHNNSADVPTDKLMDSYTTEKGDNFVEGLIVDYGKYMYIASSRPGSLPPNLQGNWVASVNPAWSSDYHIDVNVQMNNWHAEQMGLGDIMSPLFDFITDTFVPRGTESAKLIYGSRGWVAFTSLNIFGHTGQGNDATWSDLYHDPAWLMATVWDRYDYSRDANWYATVGYPLMKGVAQFWLDTLLRDEYYHQLIWVANPCNSPEQGPTTFGCAQFQQVIWELFDHIIKDWDASGDTDTAFLKAVKDKFAALDPGVTVGRWGQIQEWKLDIDVQNNTHRHLSHLNGWYPGYIISGYYGKNETIVKAVETSLYSRGNGTEDSNTGWEKSWRAACWARLGVVDEAYKIFKYAIDVNFGPNALSIYTASNTPPYKQSLPFQIDANFGQSAAALAMLATDLPQASGDKGTPIVTVGPSIPKAWAGGSVRGLRLRGGGQLDFGWTDDGLVEKVTITGRTAPIKIVNKKGTVIAQV